MAEGAQRQLTEEDLKNMTPEQIIELQKQNCIFCHIITGKVPSKNVYSDAKVFAVLDINPANPGHILLMPKDHYAIMPQVPEEILNHLAMTSKHLSKVLIKSLKVQGTNVFVANGAAAGQRAQHFMLHLIPRKEKDGLTCFTLQKRQAQEGQLQKIHEVLKKRIEQVIGTSKEMQQKPETMLANKQPTLPAKKPETPIAKLTSSPVLKPSISPTSNSSSTSAAGFSLDDLNDSILAPGLPDDKELDEPNKEKPKPDVGSKHAAKQHEDGKTQFFASNRGQKYHKGNCPFLDNVKLENRIEVTGKEISERQLKPCRCTDDNR